MTSTAPRISDDLIERAKAVRIEDELRRRGIHQLKRSGGELTGPCPRCGGRDRFSVHIQKQVFNCRHCAVGGGVIDFVKFIDGVDFRTAVTTLAGDEPRQYRHRETLLIQKPNAPTYGAARIWDNAIAITDTAGADYLIRRGIPLDQVPDAGGLRFHPRCPMGEGGRTAPCIVARFTDAITGHARGLWRRPVSGEKPRTLGPMRDCLIRLWPDDEVTDGLVLGEGVETTLAAATRIVHRGTMLRPAWAAGCANNMRTFPVLAGIEALTLLVDNDASGTGQLAAAECAQRWLEAGREVIRLTPRDLGDDFNDLVRP
jgi:phage/plasmid primase-like uncharacterized protein